jgi:hypothetical protein
MPFALSTGAQSRYPSSQLELYGLQKALQAIDKYGFGFILHVISDNIGVTSFKTLRLGNPRKRIYFRHTCNTTTLNYTLCKMEQKCICRFFIAFAGTSYRGRTRRPTVVTARERGF